MIYIIILTMILLVGIRSAIRDLRVAYEDKDVFSVVLNELMRGFLIGMILMFLLVEIKTRFLI